MVGGRREASVDVGVEDGEVGRIDGVEEFLAALVVGGRKPISAVGVEIADDDSVTIGMVEKAIKWRLLVDGVAGVNRRKIHIVTGEGEVAEMNLYGLNFEMWIGVENVGVDGRKFNGVMNKKRETTAISRTILAKQRIIWKRRTWIRRRRTKFCFLQTHDFDIFVMEKSSNLSS